jgi:DNA-directed RNA polymerase subunit alpha
MLNQYDLKFTKVSEDKNSGVFSFEPLPTGFGHTLGSALRRVALTSIKGAAITSFNIPGVTHSFQAIDGVKEDLIEVTLNLKEVRFKAHSEGPFTAGKISKKGPGVVTAGDIEITSELEVVNKDLVICTLADKNSTLEMEVKVETGVGFSPTEGRENKTLANVLVDAIFSPVKNVSYSVDTARVGRQSGLDKLVLEVETDGSVMPVDVIKTSAAILRDFFSKFASTEESQSLSSLYQSSAVSEIKADNSGIDDLPLNTRTINALKKHGITSLSELRSKSDEEISDIKNLGEKSIDEIRKLLGRA